MSDKNKNLTVQQKRQMLLDYCDSRDEHCDDCAFASDNRCGIVPIYQCGEDVLDEVLDKIPESDQELLQPDTTDNVNHPHHYNFGNIECIDAMESAFGKEEVKYFCLLNAFKYLYRCTHKNGMEDVNKACWYLNKFKSLSEEVGENGEGTETL